MLRQLLFRPLLFRRRLFSQTLSFFALLSVLVSGAASELPPEVSLRNESTLPTIDLRQAVWGDGRAHALDGMWRAYWGQLLTPERISTTKATSQLFPVPAVWDSPLAGQSMLPTQGYMTYQVSVLVPEEMGQLNLYIPDMPSAYQLWVNGELRAQNGRVGRSAQTEEPAFLPKVVKITGHQGRLDVVIQLSNFHYREGGIWFSLRLTDDSGYFAMALKPIIYAVFFAAILIAIGLYNLSLYVFRTKEVAALYFGFLCLAVGVRRLLIDERIVYMFEWFDWATLQRVEHLCFYLSLPLFMGFFASLYRAHVPAFTKGVCWLLISPFVLLSLMFPARIYTEFNVAFQMLVAASVISACLMYINVFRQQGKNVKLFGVSLLLLALAVIHDILKSNGILDSSNNIAHFGVLAFVVSQSIALQRSYLKSLNLVEKMSTQLESQNRELIRLDEFKDEFLATTSHELRTPLHGISGLAKVITESDHGQLSPDQRSKIELIGNTSQRLSVLVNDILDFSSIKHGKLKLNVGRVDLSALSELVLSTLKPMVAQKDITLSARVDPHIRYLEADEFRFQQILFNLMGNAVKYTEKGSIQLTAYPMSRDVVIEISDSGVGIPAEKRQLLFRPFEQIHVQGHPSASGTGLGLSISRQLVELHGGLLDIDSEVGQGTTVRLSFPSSMVLNDTPQGGRFAPLPNLEEQPADLDYVDQSAVHDRDDPVPVTKPGNESREQGNTGPLIFVVDDEHVNRELVTSQLTEQGYRTETFADGPGVLQRLNAQVPDLILLDYMMPKMTGLEVCQLIRNHYDSYEMPVMMLTARHQIDDIVEALGAGANDYLIKPYHDKELLARVSSQLNVRKYWIANGENQKLQHEIARREVLEEELSELNTRLLNVLDISTELIVIVNDHLHVVYANEKAMRALSDGGQGILGKSVLSLVNQNLARELEERLDHHCDSVDSIESPGNTPDVRWHVLVKRLDQQHQVCFALVILPVPVVTRTLSDPVPVISGLTQELSESRKKIDQIENALKQLVLVPDLEESKPRENARQSTALPQSTDTLTNKKLIVTLHRTTLHLWERYTNKDKADLAERSRCWRVYLDGTTVKTRTFDKYLNVKSIPNRPRWRAVVRTANYVLASCDLSEDDRTELTRLSNSVEDLYS